MIKSEEIRKINAKYKLHYVDEYETIDKYLNQQEKVNELLELYRQQRKTTTFEKWHKRNNRIEELESEINDKK